jgi:hypothetical protein
MIEVKDHSQHPRTKTIDLIDEMACKVRDTLAGLVAAQTRADGNEQDFARRWLACRTIRVVLHLEQPATVSRLRPQAIDPAHLRQELRKVLKALDPHPLVVDHQRMPETLPWQVSIIP